MARIGFLCSIAQLTGATIYCCYEQWEGGCDHYKGSGQGLCSNDSTKSCVMDADCGAAPSPPVPIPVPTPRPVPVPLPVPVPVPTPVPSPTPPGAKIPLHVVLRMDDFSPVDVADVQAAVLNWMIAHQVKFNFGIIAGNDPTDPWSTYWPANCPGDDYCDDPSVMAVQAAYDNGHVLGTSQSAVLEIGNHAFNHEGWSSQWAGYQPKDTWHQFQIDDFKQSQALLTTKYPNAKIRYFAAPTNMADAQTMEVMKANGLDILTAQGTIPCDNSTMYPHTAPFWGYLYTPCMVESKDQAFQGQCVPENDVWASSAGFANINGVFSAPANSANSHWPQDVEGISADDTLGVDACGCTSDGLRLTCGLVSAAKKNAERSNGLHWTVMMMHPQTKFPGQTYTQWLDEFYAKAMSLEHYEVNFINFADLVQLKAQATEIVV